jgi:hypothetical protein
MAGAVGLLPEMRLQGESSRRLLTLARTTARLFIMNLAVGALMQQIEDAAKSQGFHEARVLYARKPHRRGPRAPAAARRLQA